MLMYNSYMNDYIILSASSTDSLEVEVRSYMRRGYMPIGGVSVAMDQGRYEYVQAMLKA